MSMRWIVCAVVLAGCGSEREIPSAPPVARVEPPPLETPPPPVDRSLGSGFEMRGLVRDGRITIVPIIATGAIPAQQYVTLADGMARGTVRVREVAGADITVDRVWVHNRSALPLFAVSGELVIEGRQDRVLAESVVIPAGASTAVPVRCVERDREAGARSFKPGNVIAELAIRHALIHGDQQAVWSAVEAINERESTQSPSSTYRHAAALQRKSPIAPRRDRLRDQLAAHPDRARMVGLAIAIDGRVLAIDRFTTPALFQALEDKLLASYVAGEPAGPPLEGPTLTPDAVRALAQLSLATQTTAASLTAMRPANERLLDPTRDPWE